MRFAIELDHGETWTLEVGVQPVLPDDVALTADEFEPHRVAERARAEESLAHWNATTPRLRTGWHDLDQTWERSVADIAAPLRVAGYDYGWIPAAGAPGS